VGGRTSINDLCRNLIEISQTDIKPVHTDSRAGDVRDSLADISKAREFLGYNPTIEFREGLEKTFNWFKNNF
jgi:nucleoside-diphosphate-sugar epimerase